MFIAYHRPAAVALLAALATASALHAQTRPDPALERGAATIQAADIQQRIDFLASDAMRGRDTPSPELDSAAHWIAAQLKSFGLQPMGDRGGYIQQYPFARLSFDRAAARLGFEKAPALDSIAFGRDYFFVPGPSAPLDAEAVLIGSAQKASAAIPAEVKGRIAVVTLGLQPGIELLMIPRRAAEAGAVGVVFVMHPLHGEPIIQLITYQMEHLSLQTPIPTAGLRMDRARTWLAAAGVDTLALADTALAGPIMLPRVRMTTGVVRQETMVPNVVALIRGSDPKLRDEYVVLSAHFDHVGVGQAVNGDSIYNGADDNASGTATVMEVAQALAAGKAPRRSVIVALVSGEEKGLLGSLYFADHPPVGPEKIVADINMDMVGRNAADTVVAVGQEYTSLGDLARRISADHQVGLAVVQDPKPEEQAFFRSDHVAFVKKDIPSIFFTGWLHPDYHKPSDAPATIVPEKAARIARLTYWMVHDIGSTPGRPTWLPGMLDKVHEVLKQSPF